MYLQIVIVQLLQLTKMQGRWNSSSLNVAVIYHGGASKCISIHCFYGNAAETLEMKKKKNIGKVGVLIKGKCDNGNKLSE